MSHQTKALSFTLFSCHCAFKLKTVYFVWSLLSIKAFYMTILFKQKFSLKLSGQLCHEYQFSKSEFPSIVHSWPGTQEPIAVQSMFSLVSRETVDNTTPSSPQSHPLSLLPAKVTQLNFLSSFSGF